MLDIKDLNEQLQKEGLQIVALKQGADRDGLTRAAVAALKALADLSVEDRRKALGLATRMLKTR